MVVQVKEFSVFNYTDDRQSLEYDNIDDQINRWIEDVSFDIKMPEIKIIDIKYHTQLNNGQFDTSALVIYEIDRND